MRTLHRRMRTLAPARTAQTVCVGSAASRRRPPAMCVEAKLGHGDRPVSLENLVPAVPASGEDEATETVLR